jgi:dihydrolipoamide dehydrogenase
VENFDLVVIGSGPGGYIAAIRGAQLGLKVACVEKDATLGGTCLNIGCIPSKALLESSHLYVQTKEDAREHGITTTSVKLDLAKLMGRKSAVVDRLTTGVAGLFQKNKITHVKGVGRISSPNSVDVEGADGIQTLQAKNILIATGSIPSSLPGITIDEKRIVSSTGALSFSEVPKKLIVIGGGFIGLELGSVWARLGSEVEVIEYAGSLVPNIDAEISKMLQGLLKKQGLNFHLNTAVKAVQLEGSQVKVEMEHDGKISHLTADRVLMSVGRKPYIENLGLDSVGIKVDKRGFIEVNSQFQTNVPSIYAVGDVIGGAMLAHKSEEEGVCCVEGIVGEKPKVNYHLVPGILYTHPEVAAVGATEQELKEKNIPYRVGKFRFSANGRAIAAGEMDGMVKIIAHKETDEVLGAHIIASHASEMIHELCVAMEFSATAEDIAMTMHGHPTLSEAIKEAALAVHGRTLNS